MVTIGHLIIGILIPFLIYFAINEKYSIEIGLYFLAGSILPDTWTIIRMFIFPDITKYISWNFTHGFIAWIVYGFMFAIIFFLLFKKISKLKFTQIFFILLLSGWLHLGIDMMTQPVRMIGDFRLSISGFFIPDTIPYMILGEQDFIIVFYIVFIVIPIMLLIKCLKCEHYRKDSHTCNKGIKNYCGKYRFLEYGNYRLSQFRKDLKKCVIPFRDFPTKKDKKLF